MANFNTYQTRHFYVAKAIDANVDTNGDIALKTTTTGEAYFSYRNADGLLTRSDLIKPENIVSLKLTSAADMATPLMAHTITIDTNAVTLSNLVGKDIALNVTLHQIISYDSSDSILVAAHVTGTSANTASAGAFYAAVAKALVDAMPKMADVPFKVFLGSTEITKATSSIPTNATALVIVPAPGKYTRGKLSKEALEISVASSVRDSNVEDIAWAIDTVAKSTVTNNTVIPGVYALADLEYFALGERGDIYRGSTWPNNYEPTYMIDLTKDYNVLSVEFFWQGSAENVQKSPRMIQVAAEAADSSDVATTLYNSLKALTPAGKFADLDSRVETLEG